MNKRAGLPLIWATSFLSLIGCQQYQPVVDDLETATIAEIPSLMQGTSWKFVAVYLNDYGASYHYEEVRPTIQFEGSRVSGSLGCSSFEGEVRIQGDGAARIENASVDLQDCPDPIEAMFSDFISSEFTLEISSGYLYVYGKLYGNSATFIFER